MTTVEWLIYAVACEIYFGPRRVFGETYFAARDAVALLGARS